MKATLKSQEQFFKKTLRQNSAKHFKDILSIRKSDTQHTSRSLQSQANARFVMEIYITVSTISF